MYYSNNYYGLEVKEEANEIPKKELKRDVSSFATYEEIAVNIKPNVPKYSVQANLGNVTNIKDFHFSDTQKALLAKNAFVVEPSYDTEFFSLYESNRSAYVPNFITTDSMLHNYHLLFDYLLRTVEREKLVGELKELNKKMVAGSLAYHEVAKGTEWEKAAKTNVAFFVVGSKLLDPSVDIPKEVSKEVGEELVLIKKHEGIATSPIMGVDEDYSQYIPRGHYEKSEELSKYFKSMMWYGRMTFLMKEEDKVRSAMLMTILIDKQGNKENWEKIYEPINFFVGKSDDITYYQFREVMEGAYGKDVDERVLMEDNQRFKDFFEMAKRFDPPKINSMPIFNEEIEPDRDEAITGFRFMGQRFTIDASIFQRLIDREVKGRMLPKGLDIPAAMGSDEALKILKDMGETEYPGYTKNMDKMRTYLKEMPQDNWKENLYFGWMYQLKPLLEEKGEGYPSFMQNDAWKRKDLNTFLGSWAQLKHDTILYAKQVYAEMGGYFPEEADDRGYVEPNVYVYARLASLLDMTLKGLESRGLLSDHVKEDILKMKELSISLKNISEKELNGQKLTDEEYELIRSYGGQLEHLWMNFNKDEIGDQSVEDYLNENNVATIADVATDPNGKVLEEGVGRVQGIYVIVPIDGKLRLTRGGTYSYYEFDWPMNDRLTDKKWREMLYDDNLKMPEWTKSFIAE
jgi:hypothetical protein